MSTASSRASRGAPGSGAGSVRSSCGTRPRGAGLAEPLARLRALGVRVAVDEAGSGFASFSHIVRLRPEIIKLDRTLVSGVDDDAARRALAAAVVMFAFEIDATVVAEGVETQP